MLRITHFVSLHKTRAVGCRVSDGILSSQASGVTGNGNLWAHEQLPLMSGYMHLVLSYPILNGFLKD